MYEEMENLPPLDPLGLREEFRTTADGSYSSTVKRHRPAVTRDQYTVVQHRREKLPLSVTRSYVYGHTVLENVRAFSGSLKSKVIIEDQRHHLESKLRFSQGTRSLILDISFAFQQIHHAAKFSPETSDKGARYVML
ncbi:hypothetical protein AXG93_857s1090 [Marchantia polymorpha subsp. ruderalis]|uniref:Uncharacterized protein n=1 Tax=Marchantia polymorpha subsp. ruderalis TaxID=1480154 RepID=A0A176WCE7_MARPO|nr:hypothetical protein AXG93_857s1090 [Marchantia polymorpha subsp. ruderalis]